MKKTRFIYQEVDMKYCKLVVVIPLVAAFLCLTLSAYAVSGESSGIIFDSGRPVIARVGMAEIILPCGVEYVDPGAMATDACGGNLTSRIQVTNPVDAFVPGTYTVRYNAVDDSGISANEVLRTVIVQDNCLEGEGEGEEECSSDSEAPVISQCAAESNLPANVDGIAFVPAFTDIVVEDSCTSTENLLISQEPAAGTQVNAGEYEIIIAVSDDKGNTSTCTTLLGVTPWPWRFGDANLDGNITVADITEIMSIIAGGTVTEDSSQVTADIDRDGSVTQADMLAIFAFIRSGGIVSEVPRNLIAQSGINEIILLWGPVPHDNVEGYVIERRIAGESSWVRLAQTPDPVYYDKSIASARYEYRVAVVDVLGNVETFSDIVSVLGNTLMLWAPWAQGLAGDEVIAPIGIGSTRGLNPKDVSITINYDNSIMQFEGILKTVLSSSLDYLVDDSVSGQVTIFATAPLGQLPVGEGRFFDLRMKLNDGLSDGCHDTEMSRVIILNNAGEPIAAETISGAICVGNVRWGDLDGDGQVTISDAQILLEIVVRNETPTPEQLFLGDLNGDRRIDAADAVLVLRLSLGLQINPGQENKLVSDKTFGSRTVSLPETVSIAKGCSFALPITVDNAEDMAGMDLVVSFTRADLRCDFVCPAPATAAYEIVSDIGPGYTRISLGDAVSLPAGETVVAYMMFTATGEETVVGVRPAPRIRIHYAEIKGEMGESFRWYGDIYREDATVTILPVDTCDALPDCEGLSSDEGETGTGSLRVFLGPHGAVSDGAQWRRTGTTKWQDSEDTEAGLAIGTYQLEFKGLDCWTTPVSQNILIQENKLTTAVAEYQEITECEGEGDEGEPIEGEGELIEGENEGEIKEGEMNEGEPTEGEQMTLEAIAEYLQEEFSIADTNGNGILNLEEAQSLVPYLTDEQFGLLDLNNDGGLSRGELPGMPPEDDSPTCCGGSCSSSKNLKHQVGDWLLIGVSLLVLLRVTGSQKR